MTKFTRSRQLTRVAAPLAILLVVLQVNDSSAMSAAEDETATGTCGNTVGVASPPAGAVVVDPGADLSALTRTSPAGTTFWLSPGTHLLTQDRFGQVIPKDGDTFLGAPGAVLDGAGINQAAFTQQATGVVIQGLTIRGFVAPQNQGVVNHDSGPGWVIQDNTIEDNKGAAMMAGNGQRVIGNCLRDNGQYGINAYRPGGLTDLVIEDNEIAGNNTDDWETQVPGCGCSGGVKFWSVNGADIRGNWVHHNHGAGIWADTNNNDFVIEDNVIEDNDSEALFYELSYNLVVSGNTFRRNALPYGRRRAEKGDNFPVGAIYISESGGEPRVPARTDLIDIRGNMFSDNWSGITLWENADRFCNSPANTSSNSCTLLAPSVQACSAPDIAQPPLYDDCRWRTKRVEVRDNTFEFDSDTEGCRALCGRMAVLSNYGTYPDWSPYKAYTVADSITFGQENHWSNNKYYGPWTFVAHDPSRSLSIAQWQAAPYGQDTCSTFENSPGCDD